MGLKHAPVSWDTFEGIRLMACSGAQKLFALYTKNEKKDENINVQKSNDFERTPLFSLKNRLQSPQ